jgi:uncharacterized membrane protein YedE/YeeE
LKTEWIHALEGGILIGIAVSLMLFWNGRVTGISGIVYGVVKPMKGNLSWRLYFLLGLVAGGLVLRILKIDAFASSLSTGYWTTAMAGLLVGFGTVLGSGCTSGHGICGMSRLSLRSFVATALFIVFGILSVFAFKKIGILI